MAKNNVTTRRPLAAVIEEITERHERLYGLADLITRFPMSSHYPVMYGLIIAVEECEALYRAFTEYETRATEAGHQPGEEVQKMCEKHHTAESLFRLALSVFDPENGSYDMEKYNVPGLAELAGDAINDGYATLPNFEEGEEAPKPHSAAEESPTPAKSETVPASVVLAYARELGKVSESMVHKTEAFFQMAAEQFKEHNNSDFDELELLVAGLKETLREFDSAAYRFLEEDQAAAREVQQ